MANPKKFTKIYIHNGANFDFIAIMATMVAKRTAITVNHRKGEFITIRLGARLIQFCDSYKLIQASLANACKAFDVPLSKEQPFHVVFNDKIRENITVSYSLEPDLISGISQYCEQDTRALRALMIKFEENLNKFGLSVMLGNTITMIAYNGFLLLHGEQLLAENNTLKTLSSNDYDIIKKSYSGGIVDVFQRAYVNVTALPESVRQLVTKHFNPASLTTRNIVHYDVVSSYPASMSGEFGVGTPKVTNRLMYDNNGRLLFGFYHVKIRTPNEAKGLFYTKIGGKLKAFSGTMVACLTSIEIEYFTSIGEIEVLAVYQGLYYNKSAAIFKEYLAN
jgi:hypothetical protein